MLETPKTGFVRTRPTYICPCLSIKLSQRIKIWSVALYDKYLLFIVGVFKTVFKGGKINRKQ